MSSTPDPVYRELAKTDKSKKGSANLNNAQAAASGASGASASAPPNASKKSGTVLNASASTAQVQQQNVTAPVKVPLKARVKVKAKVPSGAALPASDGDVPMGESSSSAIIDVAGLGPDDDSEEHDGHPDQDDQDMGGEDAIAMEEEYDEQYEGEGVVDTMQVEEEELRKDALGVEERGGGD